MDKIFIKETRKTPSIMLNANDGIMEIKGRSIPEDTEKTYGMVVRWLEEYLLQPKEKTVVIFYFEYLNSSSTKVLVYLMNKLLISNRAHETDVLIKWIYSDDDMLEYGKDFEELTDLKFEFIYKEID